MHLLYIYFYRDLKYEKIIKNIHVPTVPETLSIEQPISIMRHELIESSKNVSGKTIFVFF